jgi:DNA-binding phage protein
MRKDIDKRENAKRISRKASVEISGILKQKLLQIEASGANVSAVEYEIGLSNGHLNKLALGERGGQKPQLDTILKVAFGLDLFPELIIPLVHDMQIPKELKETIIMLLNSLKNYNNASELDQKITIEILKTASSKLSYKK